MEFEKLVREATPLIESGNAATRAAADAAKSTLIDLSNAAKQRPSGLTPLEVAASVAVLSVRRMRRRTTLFGTNKLVHKTMGGTASFLFLSNLITGALRDTGVARSERGAAHWGTRRRAACLLARAAAALHGALPRGVAAKRCRRSRGRHCASQMTSVLGTRRAAVAPLASLRSRARTPAPLGPGMLGLPAAFLCGGYVVAGGFTVVFAALSALCCAFIAHACRVYRAEARAPLRAQRRRRARLSRAR